MCIFFHHYRLHLLLIILVSFQILTSKCLDGRIYVWNRHSGTLFEILSGHESGGVNSVDWCPQDSAMFASCGDDKTIRIWASEPTAGDGMEVAFDSLSTGPVDSSAENGSGSNVVSSVTSNRPTTSTRSTLGGISMAMMAMRESPR